MGQAEPKRSLRCAKMSPGRAKMGQDEPKMSQDCPSIKNGMSLKLYVLERPVRKTVFFIVLSYLYIYMNIYIYLL